MTFDDLAYWAGLAVTGGTVLILGYLSVAVGIMGASGDQLDLLYVGVAGVVLGGAAACRLRADGMARTAVTATAAIGVIALLGLLLGRHEAAISSVGELLGLNAGFATLLLGAAWLFRRSSAAGTQPFHAGAAGRSS